MDILKIVLMILFAIDCIALTAIVLMQDLELSAELLILIGVRTKVVQWKEHL